MLRFDLLRLEEEPTGFALVEVYADEAGFEARCAVLGRAAAGALRPWGAQSIFEHEDVNRRRISRQPTFLRGATRCQTGDYWRSRSW